MNRPIRIGVLGLTHDHVWSNLRELRELKDGVLVAAADLHEPLLEKVRNEFGAATYSDYETMLKTESLDAVYVYADNATSVRLVELAADRGLHVLLEKPLANDLAGGERIVRAVRRSNIRLLVNWPFSWWPQMQEAMRLAGSGAIGEVWQVKYRAAHAGPRELGCSSWFCEWLYDPALNGAGALTDYCCYGAALACCLLGRPQRVVGVAERLRKEDRSLIDNALIVMTYPRAMAVTEGSWSQIGELTAYQTAIFGSEGMLTIEPRKTGRLLRATSAEPHGIELSVSPSPPEFRSASAHFLHGLETGTPFCKLCSIEVGRDAQEVLEAGLLSAKSGAAVELPERSRG